MSKKDKNQKSNEFRDEERWERNQDKKKRVKDLKNRRREKDFR